MSESNEIETCREMTPEEAALWPMESPAAAAETPPPQVPLPRFRSHKVVEAAKIVHVEEAALILDPGDGRDQFVQPVTPEWIARHAPGPGRTSLVPGYFVRYADGYESWSPAAAFEAGYCAEVPEPVTESAPDDLRIALKEANLVPPADLRLMPRRLLHGHQVNDCNGRLMIGAMDDPGPGGACHLYEIRGFDSEKNPSDPFVARYGAPADHCTLLFQNGPIGDVGVNGITNEALLAILIDRLTAFQAGPHDCQENEIALQHLASARDALAERTRRCVSAGTEGTSKGN